MNLAAQNWYLTFRPGILGCVTPAARTLGQELRLLRHRAGMSIRDLASAASVATGTVTSYEHDGPVTAQRLLRIARALGADVEQTAAGRWEIVSGNRDEPDTGPGILTDGSALVTLRVPPGFLDDLSADERAEIEADALLEIMRLARDQRRRHTTT